ncbi:hypothetical protein MNBD_BACTEROID06-666 [hydrothermal vent metagenome]|uniref:GWxTD domain-containing protein n=1 Tax=hydrothermal vent metagenome TaxID=652676 RepID=A0A3B0V278_9ZZZZ
MNLFSKSFTCFPLWLSVVMAINNPVSAQIIPSSTDVSYQLKPEANIHLWHKVITKASKKWVILEVEARNQISSDSLFYGYAYTNNLSKPLNNFSLVNLQNFELSSTHNTKLYAFESDVSNANFLILRIGIKGTEEYYTYIINLNSLSHFFITSSTITTPILQPFAPLSTSLKIAKLTGEKASYVAKFYKKNFSVALPPMANLINTNPFGKADSSYMLSSMDELPTHQEGVFSIFEEDNEKAVSFFRISSKNYPQLSSIKEIVDASIFLFTKKEKDKIANSDNTKKEYDAFWLENTGSSERAGKMISTYFKRVKESNLLFSTFKEGWKTDMGMLYIIFGPPDKVFRSDSSVEWVYRKTYELPTLVFKFNLKNENLDSEYFELERNIKYQNNWFRAIDLWRKGRKNL